MMAKTQLRIIKNTHRPVVDIYALNRADIPDKDHWRTVWEREGEPVELPDRPKRVWRG